MVVQTGYDPLVTYYFLFSFYFCFRVPGSELARFAWKWRLRRGPSSLPVVTLGICSSQSTPTDCQQAGAQ